MTQVQPVPRARVLLSALLIGPRVAAWPWSGMIALSVLGGALAPTGAWVIRSVLNALEARQVDVRYVAVLAAAGTAVGATAVIAGSLSSVTAAAVQRRMVLRVTSEMYGAVNGFRGLARFEDPEFLDSLRLADGAALAAATSLTSALLTGTQTIMSVVGFGYVLFIVWPPMAALLLGIAIPSFGIQLRLSRRAAQANKAATPSVRKNALLRSMLTDARVAKEIRLFGIGGLLRDRMLTDLDDVNAREYAAARRIGYSQACLTAIAGLAVSCGTAIVAYRTGGHQVSIGDFVLFLTAVATIESAISSLALQLPWLGRSLILYRHYLNLLAAPDDLAEGTSGVPALRDRLELRDVWFRYSDSSEWVLRGVNLTIAAGCATGLVGLNGSGKTTIVKLLCRFYDPVRGQILWDGTDIREFRTAEFRKRITATFQDFVSYDMPATECIGLGDAEHLGSLDRIRAAARDAEIDDVLFALPRGYDTLLSRVFSGPADTDDCVLLSGGQNQRVALARAMMRRDADLVILDEPSSGLDAEAEYRIHATLRERYSAHTRLLISHRLCALRECDAIIVLSNGAITERGTHHELIAASGAYAHLFELQAAGYQDDAPPGTQNGLADARQPIAMPALLRRPR